MQRKRRIAIRAAQDVSAIAAKNTGPRAAPVQEQDRLLTALERGLELSKQQSAEDPAPTRLQFIPHINDMNRRQSRFENSMRQIQSLYRPQPRPLSHSR